MKKNTSIQARFILAFGLMIILSQSCSKSNVETPSEKVSKELIAPEAGWKLQSVTADGTDQGTFFKNMTLKFSDGGYVVSNGGEVWPASGTWTFTDGTATAFQRNDGIEVSISNISSTTLVLTLSWTKTTYSGRVSSIQGKYIFTFGI